STHERFMAYLLEHYAGDFPTWLAPVQTKVLAISEKFQDYAEEVLKLLKERNIRAELAESNDSLGKRIREAELQKIPYILVVGEKEKQNRTVSVRRRHNDKTTIESFQEFVESLVLEIKTRKS
ncbi:MAG: His/Gly/Thr/Pro-type tRNA ligase C-terminal domain-containing protein, partial [Patescibacteria group bacterium]